MAQPNLLYAVPAMPAGTPEAAHKPARIGRGNPFTVETYGETQKELPPRFLIDGVIKEGSVILLSGVPKAGKSLIALLIALSVEHGLSWAGRDTLPGKVVYVAAEGGSTMNGRIGALDLLKGTHSSGFRMIRRAVQLADPEEVAFLIEAIKANLDGERPSLVILDTLARCIIGVEENSATAMGQVLRGVETIQEALGTAVMVVHHLGKSGGVRGSTSLPAGVDHLIEVRDGKIISAAHKDMADFDPIEFVIAQVGSNAVAWTESGRPPEFVAANGVNYPVTVPKPKKKAGRSQQATTPKSFEVLRAAGGGLTSVQWRDASVAAGVAKATFYEHRDKLVDGGLVELEDGLYFLKERQGY